MLQIVLFWIGGYPWCNNKRNSKLELEKGVRIPQLAKITTLFSDRWRSLNFKTGVIIWLDGKGGRPASRYSNATLNVDLFF